MSEISYQAAATAGIHTQAANIIEVFENQFPHRNYLHQIKTTEWTSICPKTGQPDFAQIEVAYVADKLCIELKSFKLYCQAYRNVGIFYENIVNKVLEDLVAVCVPHWISVVVQMTPRGGISSVLRADYPDPDIITLRDATIRCPACADKRRHTAEDWRNHPNAGVGHSAEHGKPKEA